MSDAVSLTMGNSALPSADSLICYMQLLGQLCLC